MTCTACGEHPKENTAKGFPKAVVEINNPETLVLLRKVVIPASMGDETAFPPAIGKYFNVLLHYEASGSNYLYSSDGIPTEIGANIPQELLDRIEALEDGYDDLAEDYEQLQSQVGDVSEALSAETSARELADGNLQAQVGDVSAALSAETSARENADIGLQGQIDAITSSSDVKDIVGTYTELQNYDTSTLGNDDIIKVLQDSTHNNAMTYYRWIISGGTGSWQYIGEEGPYYTKSETETLLNNKQDEITSSNKLLSDLVDDTNQTNKFVTENEKTTWNTEIENLQEEDELLKRNLQTTTGSGEEVTLEKTAELDFVKPPLPRGNTKQNTTTGKNLLNTSNANTTTVNGVTSYRSNGFYYLSGTNTKTDATWILPNTQNTNLPTFEIGQTYTMSFKGTMPNGVYAQLNGVQTSTGTQYSIGSVKNTVPSVTFTIDSGYSSTAQLFVGVQGTTTNVDCNFAIQIEKGSTATSYEPYTGGIPSPNPSYPQEVEVVTGNVEVTISNENNTESKTLPVSLGNIELCKIGDYQDYIYKNNGKWYKHKVINKYICTGEENWTYSSYWSKTNTNVFYANVNNDINFPDWDSNTSICNYFITYSRNDMYSLDDNGFCFSGTVGITGASFTIRINKAIATDLAAFKSWLSTHNIILYYELKTAIEEQITDTTLISQLEEISKTLSYQGQTNIASNTIALFDVEAYQDLKIVLEDLDLTKLSTFDSTKTQILKNVNGTLTWVDE